MNLCLASIIVTFMTLFFMTFMISCYLTLGADIESIELYTN